MKELPEKRCISALCEVLGENMAIKLNELEPTKKRWGAPTADYPQGKFINGSGKGARDGSYAHANWANDLFGFIGAILSKAGVTPNGQVETARSSQVFDALKQIIKSDIDTLGGDPSAIASGTAEAITATFTKPVTLTNGKRVLVRATAPNATASPTFAPNGLTAKTIAKVMALLCLLATFQARASGQSLFLIALSTNGFCRTPQQV